MLDKAEGIKASLSTLASIGYSPLGFLCGTFGWEIPKPFNGPLARSRQHVTKGHMKPYSPITSLPLQCMWVGDRLLFTLLSEGVIM